MNPYQSAYQQPYPQQGAYNQNVPQQSYYPQNNNYQQPSYGQPAYGDSQQTPFLKQPVNNYGFDAFNNPTAQLGLQIGSQAYQQTEQMVKKNISKYVDTTHIKYYFNVSNGFVLSKLVLLLFPFNNKSWTRLIRRSEHDGQMEGYRSPREDINAPDLYIPVMAFVTYVLTFGILLGSGHQFTPDVLGMTASTAIALWAVQVCFIRLGCYLLNVGGPVPMLDLMAYTGYKFIGIIITLVLKIWAVPSLWVNIVFGYLMVSYAFFSLRSLRNIVLAEAQASTVAIPQRRRKVNFLFIVALVDVFFAWLLIRM